MDQGRAYAIAVAVAAVTALVISAAIRRRAMRFARFALIRQDLAEVRAGHAHLHHTPSGSTTGDRPVLEPDGPQTRRTRSHPPTGRVRCVVGLTRTEQPVSPTTSTAA